jgi:hypothetical protein
MALVVCSLRSEFHARYERILGRYHSPKTPGQLKIVSQTDAEMLEDREDYGRIILRRDMLIKPTLK